jgi:hypothetical protein
MFYKLVSGEYLFDVANLNELLMAHRTPRAALDSRVPAIPAGVARVIERALCYDAAGRWPEAGAMACALEEAERAASRLSMTMVLATLPRIALAPSHVAPMPPAGAMSSAPRPSCPPGPPGPLRASHRAVIGLLLLSIATFLGSAAYGVRAYAGSPLTATAAAE